MLRRRFFLLIFLVWGPLGRAQQYVPVQEQVPGIPREFRAAWVAIVYNIDWPSKKGLGAATQKAQAIRILDRLRSLNMNAVILQVRPNADAAYASRLEPSSHWLSGRMGRSPGYDPLAFWIKEAHARGIEVHAWFNPFRALPNHKTPVSSNHVSRTKRNVIRRFRTSLWMDPSSSWTQKRALQVILDVVRRYDVDGVHLDDYFYPYPQVNKQGVALQKFPDGKSPAQRRAVVDRFVAQLYRSVKQQKPWVRVGISPFGIWRPGVPRGTTARIDAYRHLSADSRKWLAQGWVDYLSPQLYWRIRSEQSFSALLSWWRGQGSRPVWPGIAVSRIDSKEDPGRPASEILNQAKLTRSIGRNYVGQLFWSMKALQNNRGGISDLLRRSFYQEPALVPPMPWINKKRPAQVPAAVRPAPGGVVVQPARQSGGVRCAVQARYGNRWQFLGLAGYNGLKVNGQPEAVAVSAVTRDGMTSAPLVYRKK